MKTRPGPQPGASQFLAHYQFVQRLDKRRGIEIWRAQHIGIQTPVVLKIVSLANRPEQEYQRDVNLLQNEARVLSGIHHHYIIGYRDYLEGRNFRALVLEYAPYASIPQYHGSRRKLPLFPVRLYTAQIGRALAALHRQGQVHRDVKPSNMLLLHPHHAVLADFELAMDDPTRRYPHKHSTGGTIFYMAPEQYRGAPCAASDQYSLAICVYEWLTGHRPFSGETQEVPTRRAFSIPRSVRIERPELPLSIDRVLWTALHPDPARRYPTIMDFVNAFLAVTRAGHPPLSKRLPYYRRVPWRGMSQGNEPFSTLPRWPETGEQPVFLPQPFEQL